MKNKKALLENTLKVIIAVVGLAIIFYGAAKIYTNYIDDTPEKAKALADIVESKIQTVISSGEKNVNLTIQGFDENWYLHGFDESKINRPGECFLEPCICVCPEINVESCTGRDAACRTFENLKEIKLAEYSILLRIKSITAGAFTIQLNSDPIRLEPKLIGLEVTYEEEKLKIEVFDQSYFENYAEFKREFPNQPLPRELK